MIRCDCGGECASEAADHRGLSAETRGSPPPVPSNLVQGSNKMMMVTRAPWRKLHTTNRGSRTRCTSITLLQEDLTRRIIGAFFEVYKRLGGGFAEAVYEEALARELEEAGLAVERQAQILVHYRGGPVGRFRSDIVVNEVVLIEIKAREELHSVHRAQMLNYLRATSLEIGLLFNFGPKPEFKRLVFSNSRKKGRR